MHRRRDIQHRHERPGKQFLTENDLDNESELVLRREIAVNGKTRSFINDTPATLQQLKQLASLLVDLHQQFDTLELGDTDFQREVIDALAGNKDPLTAYRSSYFQWKQAAKELEALQQQKSGFNKELDYNQFLFDELDELNLKENELETLDQELKLLSNAEAIKTTLTKVYYELKESEQPVTQLLKQLVNQLHGYAEHHPGIPAIILRLQSAQIELSDIAGETEQINNAIQFDEQRINLINDKLAAGYKLLKKHGVTTTNELIGIHSALEQKLQAVLNIDEAIASKEKQVQGYLDKTGSLADALSKSRKKQVKPLEENVNRLLEQVGMPNARVKIDITEAGLDEYGRNKIEFLFDANKSNRFEPIRKVASGGELSRLMLCIKSLVAQHIDLPTMIFDEIDTGISGEAAKQVGIIMKGLAAKRQIICITHQPQIAGKANAHFFVYKEIRGEAIKTNIRLLNEDERITAIAKMLSGEKPTAAALENARELMN
jgi:DNA repair protein RecN (Recombination protein N)